MVSYLDCGLELLLLAIFRVGWVGRGVAGLVGDLLLLFLKVCGGLGEGGESAFVVPAYRG